MISRILNLQINTCSECPYCQYDGSYGRSYDSGWDCEYLGRLCDDNEFQRYHKKLDEWSESQKIFQMNVHYPKYQYKDNLNGTGKNNICLKDHINDDQVNNYIDLEGGAK
jgi:hypothetical protein